MLQFVKLLSMESSSYGIEFKLIKPRPPGPYWSPNWGLEICRNIVEIILKIRSTQLLHCYNLLDYYIYKHSKIIYIVNCENRDSQIKSWASL